MKPTAEKHVYGELWDDTNSWLCWIVPQLTTRSFTFFIRICYITSTNTNTNIWGSSVVVRVLDLGLDDLGLIHGSAPLENSLGKSFTRSVLLFTQQCKWVPRWTVKHSNMNGKLPTALHVRESAGVSSNTRGVICKVNRVHVRYLTIKIHLTLILCGHLKIHKQQNCIGSIPSRNEKCHSTHWQGIL